MALTDTRMIRAFPERYIGHIVECDTVATGPLRAAPATDLRLHELGLSHSRLTRCRSGAVELAFRPSSSALAAYVRTRRRIRARVVDTGVERHDTPVLEFIAQADDELDEVEPDPHEVAPLAVGDDFRPAALGSVDQTARRCVVAWTGVPRAIVPSSSRAAPTTYALPVSCHTATQDAWVELHLSAAQVPAALAVPRGDTLTLRVTSLAGGLARYPVAQLDAVTTTREPRSP